MIEWMAFVAVFGASLLTAVGVVTLYSLGIRFLAVPAPKVMYEDGTFEPDGPSRDDENDDVDDNGRPLWASAAATVCFAFSIAAVLLGIYLIVPALHS